MIDPQKAVMALFHQIGMFLPERVNYAVDFAFRVHVLNFRNADLLRYEVLDGQRDDRLLATHPFITQREMNECHGHANRSKQGK